MFKRALILLLFAAFAAHASDHLDTPTVIADPAADIGDLYAWTSADGRRLNLVMDIVAHQFSDKLQYVFHVDSGPQFGRTTASVSIVCRFDTAMACRANGIDASRMRLFAGLRDDPFFNNVRGTRAALNVASAALKAPLGGTKVDAAGCPHFDEATTRAILDEWRHTDGGPGRNFLAGWLTSAIVVSIDLDAVNRGGPKLAVWAAVLNGGKQIERVGRPLTKNALIGLFAGEDASNKRKEEYNRTAQKDWPQFVPDLEASLALYDGFDGRCGNAFFADPKSPKPYHRLATILADDRLWINSKVTTCKQFFALELMESGRRRRSRRRRHAERRLRRAHAHRGCLRRLPLAARDGPDPRPSRRRRRRRSRALEHRLPFPRAPRPRHHARCHRHRESRSSDRAARQ